jgi:hypothetical protein
MMPPAASSMVGSLMKHGALEVRLADAGESHVVEADVSDAGERG